LGMYCLPWHMPQLLQGAGAVEQVAALLKEKGWQRVLIVTGKSSIKYHLIDGLLAKLDEEGIVYIFHDGIAPDPTDKDVELGVKLFCDNHCDALLAFGGGSPMDCAKAMAARLARPNKTIAQLHGLLKVLRAVVPVIYIPTTSGTGSEVTMAAVITDSNTNHKAAISDICLLPSYAVLDPALTLSMPQGLTSTTGMDALCHAVEAYTNYTYTTKLERDLAKKAVKLLYDNLYHAYIDGSDITARENVQLAAYYAGRAFTRGCVGYVHAIGHGVGALYHTSHGTAMGVLLPHVMRRYGKAADKRLAELWDSCQPNSSLTAEEEKAEAFICWIEELKVKMEIPLYLPVLEEKDIPQLAEWADKEANPLYPTPVTWSRQDFTNFLQSMLAGAF
ncbi:MAG: iron-containing alcohol dehydrogenase, partial [Angelakisella sp.]